MSNRKKNNQTPKRKRLHEPTLYAVTETHMHTFRIGKRGAVYPLASIPLPDAMRDAFVASLDEHPSWTSSTLPDINLDIGAVRSIVLYRHVTSMMIDVILAPIDIIEKIRPILNAAPAPLAIA